MHVNTTKSRVLVDASEEVKALKAQVETLKQVVEDLSKRVPKPAPEAKAQ